MRSVLIAGLVGLALAQIGGCPIVTEATVPGARVSTSLGEFVIEVYPEKAPLTVANFAQYVADDFYDGTVFHRVIAGSLVQGGGYAPTGLSAKQTRPPIANEAANGLSNARGTVAMARTNEPDSATSQFYVNLADNTSLDASDGNPGYAVFGRVAEGMDVVDQIAAVATTERDGLTDVPVENIVITGVERSEITVDSATVPAARVTTSLGTFVVQLYPEQAPVSVENFLQYVDDGFYNGTVFHRVIPDFVVQGGGMVPALTEKATRAPIANESDNGRTNVRGAVALAYAEDPASATSQFIINVADNADLDATADSPGYTVFGRVVEGMDVVDSIAALPTAARDGLTDVPVENVILEDIELILIPTGQLELTPEGGAYVANQQYQALGLLRDVIVQLMSFAFGSR